MFKDVVTENLQYLPPLSESGSEVSYFIPEPRDFSEVTRFSDDINKPCLNETMKEIKILLTIRIL